MTPEDILKQIYYDPKSGHTGAQQLYMRAQKQALAAGVKITMAKVQSWLKEQRIHQAFAPNGLDRPANWFKITDVPNSYVVDTILEENYKASNGGYRGFLLFVEITTRKVYAYPFKTGSDKSPPNADEAVAIFKQFEAARAAEQHPVARISGDQGKELTNKKVADFLHEQHIQTYFHRAADHYANGLLNVVARYVRSIIERDVEHSGSLRWIDKLKDAVENWNEHRISHLKASPDELWDDKGRRQDVREAALAHNNAVAAKAQVAPGDTVKTYLRRNTKQKGIWSKESATFAGEYKVLGRQGYSWKLADTEGNELPNRYRAYELRKVPNPSPAGVGGEQVEEEIHPREQAVQEARVKRRVAQAVGQGAAERIVREKRQPKPRQLDAPEPAAAPKAKAEPKARYKKGQVVRIVEYVLRHRVDPVKDLEFKVKWKHLSVGESLALPWEPLSSFVETIGGVKYYNKAIDEYMTEHGLEEADE